MAARHAFEGQPAAARRAELADRLEGANSTLKNSRLGITTRSSPGPGLCRRYIVRTSRLARLRTTEPPILRVAAMPSRLTACPFFNRKTVMYRPGVLRPCWYTRSKSARRRMRSAWVNV
jgi:hypothetical protein